MVDDTEIKKYLLGSAAAEDEEEISLRLISDAGFADRLDHAESELIEDYLDGMLSDEEIRLFRANFLTSAERRKLMHELELLRAGLRGAAAASPAKTPAQPKVSQGEFFSFFSRPLFAAAGLFILLVAGASIWYTFIRDGRSPLEIEYASLNRSDLADPAKTGPLSTISIIPANFRDNTATASFPASKLTNPVVFRLALMDPEQEGAEREVSLERSGRRVFTAPGRVFRTAFGSEIRVMVPKEALPPGNYELLAKPAENQQAPSRYQLRIE